MKYKISNQDLHELLMCKSCNMHIVGFEHCFIMSNRREKTLDVETISHTRLIFIVCCLFLLIIMRKYHSLLQGQI